MVASSLHSSSIPVLSPLQAMSVLPCRPQFCTEEQTLSYIHEGALVCKLNGVRVLHSAEPHATLVH